jgi:hypothetical protein
VAFSRAAICAARCTRISRQSSTHQENGYGAFIAQIAEKRSLHARAAANEDGWKKEKRHRRSRKKREKTLAIFGHRPPPPVSTGHQSAEEKLRPKPDRWRFKSVTCENHTPKLNTGIDRSVVHPGL